MKPVLLVLCSVLTSALTFVFVTSAQAADLRYTAKVYDLDDGRRQNLLFNYRSESEPVGDTIVVNNRFTYPDGRLATHEEITFTKDGKVTRYRQEQAQLGAKGTIEFNDGKAKFTWTRNGKTKSDIEDAGPDFIVGSQIPLELEAHWNEIMKGETLKRRLAVLERLESIGFNFSKEGEATVGDKKAVIIKMKPSSFFIAAIVSPIHFYLSEDGKELLEIKGRTTVKKDKGGGRFSDLDADVVYTKGPAADIQPPDAAHAPVGPAVKASAHSTGGNSK